MKQTEVRGGDPVTVLCVLKKNAKAAKQALEGIHALHKRYRMIPSVHHSDCIALPITISTDNNIESTVKEWKETYHWDWIQHVDRQVCPFSTAVLGNHSYKGTDDSGKSYYDEWLQGLNSTQQALYHVICKLAQRERTQLQDKTTLQEDIQSMDLATCPKKLEIFGDDRTLVLPPTAIPISTVDQLLNNHVGIGSDKEELRFEFWKELAAVYNSPRIARRGTVDPESKIRESGHRLIWPVAGIPDDTGPGSPGWIKVTEQGIGQSLDMTRVMFSRGNISEKIRFGKLVQPGEQLLDMYAGIGYYTLPALVIGKAAHVVACEWNEHAVNALRFNVQDNKVSDRVTILQGDCRVSCQEHGLVNRFDRISLGLLPSAEGGWRTAIKALGPNGGWLHIHANVPVQEVEDWSFWMSRELWNLVQQERSDKCSCNDPDKWIVLCHHVEKVKSFAPTVAHYVADVYVGRIVGFQSNNAIDESIDPSTTTAAVVKDGALVHCPPTVKAPSCALSPDGVLSQAWMR